MVAGSQHPGLTEEQLNTLGNAWQRSADETRWYVNDWMAAIGLEVEFYNTGNVCYVEYRGEKMSNNWFYKQNLGHCKVWIDREGAVHVDRCNSDKVAQDIIDKVGERIEALLTVPEQENEGEEYVGPMCFAIFTNGVANLSVQLPEGETDFWTAIEQRDQQRGSHLWDVLTEDLFVEVAATPSASDDNDAVIYYDNDGETADSTLREFLYIGPSSWSDVLDEAQLREWDQGDRPDVCVQEGTWRGHKIRITYRIPDQVAFDQARQEDERKAFLDAILRIRLIPGCE